jgi:hypothetical protein
MFIVDHQQTGKRMFIPWVNYGAMVSESDVRNRYRSYVEDYPENTGLAFESDFDTEYPLKERALGGSAFSGVYLNQIAAESSYLFELDDRVPGIDSLDVDLMPTISVELIRVLFVQITHDHMTFWNFTKDLLSHPSTKAEDIDPHIIDLYSESVNIMSSNKLSVSTDGLSDEVIGCYIAYPLLEAVCKWFCEEYIEMNGDLKPGEEILRLGGGTYGPPEKGDEYDKCSDIGSLLLHIEQEVAAPNLRNHLEDARRHIGDLYEVSPSRVYGKVIKAKRNDSLHGQDEAPAEVGVLLNLTSLLIWSSYLG